MASTSGTIRKLPSGKYQVRITDPSAKQISIGTFTSKAIANAELHKAMADLNKGDWNYRKEKSDGAKLGRHTALREVAERYNKSSMRAGKPLSPRTLKEYSRYTERDLASLAPLPVASITKALVEDWYLKMGEPKTGQVQAPLVLRQRVYSYLKSVMKYAEDSDLISRNPCRISGALGSSANKPMIFPTSKDVALLIEVAPKELKALFAIAASAGLRKGELLELRRKDVEKIDGYELLAVSVNRGVIWTEGTASVREPKWSSIRKVTLDLSASKTLDAHLRNMNNIDPEALLFPNDPGGSHFPEHKLNRIYDRMRKTVGYSGTFHSFRHYAGTQYGILGATLIETLDRLGHSNYKTGLRYQQNTHRELELLSKVDK
jgi:integrase